MTARPTKRTVDAALSLALAVVASSTSPLLLLDGDLNVVAASTTFCDAFDIDPDDVPGRAVFALGAGEWDIPQLRSLLKATLSGDAQIDAYELDLKRPGKAHRSLALMAQKLTYDDEDNVRLLLAVTDLTDARAAEKLKDDLLREKAILLQEVRHRVANSLQIIASVLLQNARKTQSDETRTHLRDAHNRVMSVAALERQLAASTLGEVTLRVYFGKLCETIGASMIRDPAQISLTVAADDSAVSADMSVSLGLIVTELVINALKHAFPERRKGKIVVGFETKAPNWTLSVTDDGIGMPKDPAHAKAGLGTTIVEALAKQLSANVRVADARPGTTVSIVHAQIAAVEGAQAARAV